MKIETAIEAIRRAATRVHELRASADPGHIPMRKYLQKLERKLRTQADELEYRCNYESGERP